MADSNYDLIKPVENLQNVGGLTPVQQQKERKRRRNPQQQNPEEYAEDLTESVEENLDQEAAQNQSDGHSIDYCA